MSEMSWPAKNNRKLRWRSARRVVRTREACGGSAIGLQPVDADLGREGAEFRVARHKFSVALLGQRGGEGVNVGNFVAGFVRSSLQHHRPVNIDACKADFCQCG